MVLNPLSPSQKHLKMAQDSSFLNPGSSQIKRRVKPLDIKPEKRFANILKMNSEFATAQKIQSACPISPGAKIHSPCREYDCLYSA
jgi:hypothetical protein